MAAEIGDAGDAGDAGDGDQSTVSKQRTESTYSTLQSKNTHSMGHMESTICSDHILQRASKRHQHKLDKLVTNHGMGVNCFPYLRSRPTDGAQTDAAWLEEADEIWLCLKSCCYDKPSKIAI